MKSLQLKLAALAFASCAAVGGSSAAYGGITNMSDTWTTPGAPQQRVVINHAEETASITLMLFAADGSPVWYTADGAELIAISAGEGLPYFSGTLVRVQNGPAGSQAASPVGVVTLSPTSSSSATLEYTIDGVSTVRTIVRQTVGLPNPAMSYAGSFSVWMTSNNRATSRASFNGITQIYFDDETTGTMITTINGVRCEYNGAYSQSGRLGAFAGTFTCTDGRNGPFQVEQLEFTNNGFSGKIRVNWNRNGFYGTFGGPRS